MMSNLGEKMTREEMQEMMMEADGNNNANINYKCMVWKYPYNTYLRIQILEFSSLLCNGISPPYERRDNKQAGLSRATLKISSRISYGFSL